jgi:hypothetical protein
MDPKTIAAWIGVIVAAGGVIGGAAKFLFWLIDEWQRRRAHEGFSAPKKTLQLASKPKGNCWWAMGKLGDDPTMQIVGRMFVTNISSVPARIPYVELRYGLLGRKRVSGTVIVSRGGRENIYGLYDIGTNETRDLNFNFWVYPPTVQADEPFIAHSVTFVDQFGNGHRVRRVVFQARGQRIAPDLNKELEEFPYAIADPVEKEVVSVLKAELARYAMCGRGAGGLGSVYIVYKEQAMIGVGTDS